VGTWRQELLFADVRGLDTLLEDRQLAPVRAGEGWIVARITTIIARADFETLAIDLCASAQTAGLGVAIYDSDAADLLAVVGATVFSRLELPAGQDARAAFEGLANWSMRSTSRPATASELAALAARRSTFVDATVRRLLDRLGLSFVWDFADPSGFVWNAGRATPCRTSALKAAWR
jgi:hypothetical protein